MVLEYQNSYTLCTFCSDTLYNVHVIPKGNRSLKDNVYCSECSCSRTVHKQSGTNVPSSVVIIFGSATVNVHCMPDRL